MAICFLLNSPHNKYGSKHQPVGCLCFPLRLVPQLVWKTKQKRKAHNGNVVLPHFGSGMIFSRLIVWKPQEPKVALPMRKPQNCIVVLLRCFLEPQKYVSGGVGD